MSRVFFALMQCCYVFYVISYLLCFSNHPYLTSSQILNTIQWDNKPYTMFLTLVPQQMHEMSLASGMSQQHDSKDWKEVSIMPSLHEVEKLLSVWQLNGFSSLFCTLRSIAVLGTYLKHLILVKQRISLQLWNLLIEVTSSPTTHSRLFTLLTGRTPTTGCLLFTSLVRQRGGSFKSTARPGYAISAFAPNGIAILS